MMSNISLRIARVKSSSNTSLIGTKRSGPDCGDAQEQKSEGFLTSCTLRSFRKARHIAKQCPRKSKVQGKSPLQNGFAFHTREHPGQRQAAKNRSCESL